MTTERRDDAETLNRKNRLRELIDACFNGSQAALLRHIQQRTGKLPNQAEISLLIKPHNGKSFGDGKAKTLCESIGLHRRWFDQRLGQCLRREEWMLPAGSIASDLKTPGIPHEVISPRHPVSAALVLQHLNGLSALLGIPLSAIVPDIRSAERRITAALEQQATASVLLPPSGELRIDMTMDSSSVPARNGAEDLERLVEGDDQRRSSGTDGR